MTNQKTRPSDKMVREDHPYDAGYWARYDGAPPPTDADGRRGWSDCNNELRAEAKATGPVRYVVWHTPYKPPQTAIGTFTEAELSAFFARKGTRLHAILADLKTKGFSESIVGYRVELDQ